jgi:purine nucleosidase
MPPASARLSAVLDTDTYNEVDDQFALAHLLLSPDRVNLEAVYAAPFSNDRSSGPADGMERSYQEIQKILSLVAVKNPPPVFRGSTRYLPGAFVPVESDVTRDLVARAMAPRHDKLHVLAIAAATNIASALLFEPRIAENIVVVWLGGHGLHWPKTDEFNLAQDAHAARVLLDSGVPLVLLPCYPVTSHLTTTVAELEKKLKPFSQLGQYLTEIISNYPGNEKGAFSKQIWDISASAWAIDSTWLTIDRLPSPILKDDLTWELRPDRHLIDVARYIDRDAIFADFFAKARQLGETGR